MNGLLDMQGAQAPMQQPIQGGLLGAAPQGSSNNSEWVQMANALIQNPTSETAKMIASKLSQSADQNSIQLANLLNQLSDSPEALKQLASKALDSMK